MTCVKIIFTIILFQSSIFLLTQSVYGQTSNEVNLMRKVINIDDHKAIYNYTKKNRNEVQQLFSGLFLFYKKFFSSQDGNSCTFTPSCSEYGIQAIKKQGLFIGIPNTIDRLTRCNGLAPEKYGRDPETGLFIDEVE